jgi:monoamine oxidase
MAMGQVIKVLVSFKRAFWREAGLSGEFISDKGPLTVAYDRCDMDSKFYAIVAFCAGAAVKSWGALSEAQRRDEAVAQLARVFKYPNAAAELSIYRDHDWSKEEFSEGCYFSHMKPSAIIRFKDALSAPVHGRVFYAGTETAREWIGYIEGALESAERVAEEVVKAESASHSKL